MLDEVNMKKVVLLLLSLIFISCEEEITPPIDYPDAKVTAKKNIDAVVAAARNGYSADAELAGIYGREVSPSGEVDLVNTQSLNAFVYIMQSDAVGENDFFIPVYGANPVRSPINFNNMLSYIKDSTAKTTVNGALSFLATINIDTNSVYDDSPAVLNTLFAINEVAEFRSAHPDTKIDMFLFPSKAIDPVNGFDHSADWVVNFYSAAESLVLWLNSETGAIEIISN